MIDNNLPYTLILEDDSVLKKVPKFLKSFEQKFLNTEFIYLLWIYII
ncbi:hypothetical protein [Gilliamella apicola]